MSAFETGVEGRPPPHLPKLESASFPPSADSCVLLLLWQRLGDMMSPVLLVEEGGLDGLFKSLIGLDRPLKGVLCRPGACASLRFDAGTEHPLQLLERVDDVCQSCRGGTPGEVIRARQPAAPPGWWCPPFSLAILLGSVSGSCDTTFFVMRR